MEPAILYLVYSKNLRAFKIGITNLNNRRYAQHRANGWRVVKYWYLDSRNLARCVEQRALKLFRSRFPDSHLNKEDMPQDGYTEAFSSDKISSRRVIRIINTIIKEYNKLDIK